MSGRGAAPCRWSGASSTRSGSRSPGPRPTSARASARSRTTSASTTHPDRKAEAEAEIEKVRAVEKRVVFEIAAIRKKVDDDAQALRKRIAAAVDGPLPPIAEAEAAVKGVLEPAPKAAKSSIAEIKAGWETTAKGLREMVAAIDGTIRAFDASARAPVRELLEKMKKPVEDACAALAASVEAPVAEIRKTLVPLRLPPHIAVPDHDAVTAQDLKNYGSDARAAQAKLSGKKGGAPPGKK